MGRENQIEGYLTQGIKLFVVLTLFAPLVLGPFGLSFSEYPKTVYFRIFVEIMVILWAILLMFSFSRGNKTRKEASFQFSTTASQISNSTFRFPDVHFTPLTFAVVAFFAALTVSAIFGFNTTRSFFGMLEIGGGLVTQFHYLAFFLIVSSIFRNRNDWILFFRIAVLVSVFSLLAGFLQRLKGIGFYGVSLQAERVSGTLSNPVYFAFFTTMAIFLAFYLIATERNKKEKIFWSLAILLNIIGVILSASRGAFLGFGIGILVIAVFSFIYLAPQKKASWRKKVLLGVLAAVLLLAGLAWFLVSSFNYEPGFSPFKIRILATFDPLGALEGRYPGWETAVRAWRDRPLFGWGPASFGYLYDKYFDAHFVNHINAYFVFQDAHNKILNLAAEAGIVGVALWLVIYIFVFGALWKLRRKDVFSQTDSAVSSSIPAFILMGFFANHFVQNLFVFDTLSTHLLFFLLLAFVNTYYFSPMSHKRYFAMMRGGFYVFVGVFLIMLSLAAVYIVNMKPALAGYDFVRGFFRESKDFGASMEFYKKGISRNTFYDRELRLLFATRVLNALEQGAAKNESQKQELLKNLISLKELLKPELGKPEFRYLELYKTMAGIDEWLYLERRDFEALREGQEILEEGIRFNDQWFQHHYFLGRYLILQGKYEEGESHFRQGLALTRQQGTLPDDMMAFYRTVGVAYWRAGVMENNLELKKRAAANFVMTARLGIEQRKMMTSEERKAVPLQTLKLDVNFIQQTINLLVQLGETDEARRIFEEAKEAYDIQNN